MIAEGADGPVRSDLAMAPSGNSFSWVLKRRFLYLFATGHIVLRGICQS